MVTNRFRRNGSCLGPPAPRLVALSGGAFLMLKVVWIGDTTAP
jgi:hypothetical protein